MNTIFKAGLVAIALFIGVNSYAQDKPITFGVKGGVNLSNVSGDILGNKAKVGFNVGVTADYALTQDVYLLSGLELTTKGFKVKDSYIEANLMYLQLPIHAGYKLLVAENTKIILHAGPYVAYGIGGKAKGTDENGKMVKVNSFGSEAFKRFDFGLGLGAGVEFGKIGVGLGWDFGLTNIARTEPGEDNSKIRNMNGYLTLGYKF